MLADTAAARGKDLPRGWLLAFAAMFANGTFGEPIASEFATCTIKNACNRLAGDVDLIWTVGARGADGTLPALDEAEAGYLDRVRGDIEEMVREARKRQGGRLARGLHSITGRRDAKDGGE